MSCSFGTSNTTCIHARFRNEGWREREVQSLVETEDGAEVLAQQFAGTQWFQPSWKPLSCRGGFSADESLRDLLSFWSFATRSITTQSLSWAGLEGRDRAVTVER